MSPCDTIINVLSPIKPPVELPKPKEQITSSEVFRTADQGSFAQEPFVGFIQSENRAGEFEIPENWRESQIGRALKIRVNNQSIGEIYGLIVGNGLTVLGREVVQYYSWFANGAFRYAKPESSPDLFRKVEKWKSSMETILHEVQIPLQLLDNLVTLTNFGIDTISNEQLEQLTLIEINNPFSEHVWDIAEKAPGYWGRRTPKEVDRRNQQYGAGRDQWNVAFDMRGFPDFNRILTSAEFATLVFERCYWEWFEGNDNARAALEYLSDHASNLYETDVDSANNQGYDLTAYGSGHTRYQYTVLKRLMFLLGIPFQGSQPIAILGQRKEVGDPVGRVLHPAAIAIPKDFAQFAQTNPNFSTIIGWWNAWEDDPEVFNNVRFTQANYGDKPFSLERLYQSQKVVVRRKNPQTSLVDELILASSGV